MIISLNSNLANKAWRNWALLYNSGYIKWTGYKTITVPNFGSYSEMLFVGMWYDNPYMTITLPVSEFKKKNNTGIRVAMQLSTSSLISFYYISDTQISLYDSMGTYDHLQIFVR